MTKEHHLTGLDRQLTYEAFLERDGLQVSRSPWGPDDYLGRLNWMTDESRAAALAEADGSRVFDLSVTYQMGMPCWVEAHDPKYDIWMTHTPEGTRRDRLSGAAPGVHDRYSYAWPAITMYSHAGTHMCSLLHFGFHGMFWNGFNQADHMGSRNWMTGGVIPPIVASAVLLDVAGHHGVECLPDSYPITADDLRRTAEQQGTPISIGDTVLIRTGRMSRWPDPGQFLQRPPGLGLEAARYLCEDIGVMCVGIDVGGEALPSPIPGSFLPVHCYMFATAGTPMIENMVLEELAAARQYRLVLTVAPMKLAGSTGLPARPIAFPRTT